jgi:O-succinylbenzoic acid--CoA ligase
MVLHEGFEAAAVNRSLDNDGVTILSAVAVMLARMLEDRGSQPYPAHLRCVLLGGGPAPKPLLEACAARHLPVVQTYGLTEAASQVATLAPEDALRKLGSAGKPLMPTELRIVKDDQPDQPAAPHRVGEIVVRGPTLSPGYLRQSAPRTTDGWFRTGDLGYVDEDGYLYVVDRRTDLIISGGENIYPAEVEAVLLAHPAIAEAAVIGLPDARWGQTPVAAIRLHDGVNPAEVGADELRAFCAARLARYKVPTQFKRAAMLPRNAAGKLMRRRVGEQWKEFEWLT